MQGTFAEIRMWGPNFSPRTWSFCTGNLLPIAANQALYSLIGTTYGGDGRSTFALPDLRGRVPTGTLQGPGLSDRRLGNQWGSEEQVLTLSELPAHSHGVAVVSGATPSLTTKVNINSTGSDTIDPQDAYWGYAEATQRGAVPTQYSYSTTKDGTTMASDAIEVTLNGLTSALQAVSNGGGAPFLISQPSLAVSMIICIDGDYPVRN